MSTPIDRVSVYLTTPMLPEGCAPDALLEATAEGLRATQRFDLVEVHRGSDSPTGHRVATAPDTRERLALPAGVACYAIAATTTPAPAKRLRSDGLVPVDSALGRHPRPELDLGFPEDHQWIGFGMAHLDLLSRLDVYERTRGWLS